MVATAFLGACMDAAAKYLVEEYPVALVVWARLTSHCLILAVFLGPRLARVLRTEHLALHLVRSLMQVAAVALMFWSLRTIPLADAAAVYLSSPIFVTVLAVPMLAERPGVRRWLGVGLGFAGALLIVRPGTGVMQPAALLALAAALAAALLQVLTRLASRYDPPLTLLAYTTLVGAVAANLALPLYWVAPRPASWILLFGVGLFGFVATIAMIRAYTAAAAATVAPYNYTGMISATAIGYLVFDHVPDPWSLAGMAVIAGSGIYIFHRERLSKETAA